MSLLPRLRYASCGLLLLVLCAAFAGNHSLAQIGQRPIEPEDLFALREIPDARLSPDGLRIAFVLTNIDRTENRYISNLWVVPVNGGSAWQLTKGEFNDSMPRWSPDGHEIAFASDRSGQSSLWVVGADTGQLRMLAAWPHSNFFISKPGEMLSWSPNGQEIALVAAQPEIPQQSIDPRVVTRIQYKSRTAFSDNLHTHIYIVSVTDGAVRQLTRGNYDDHSISWSPRNNEIAYLSNRELDPDVTLDYNIYVVNAETGEERRLNRAPGVDYSPVWSPDGKHIAYLATQRKATTVDSVAEDQHVWVVDREGGSGKMISGVLDRRAFSPQWSSDSQTVYFIAGDQGETNIYGVSAKAGGMPKAIVRGRASIETLSAASANLSFVRSDEVTPAEVWVAGEDGSNPHPVSSFNKQLADDWRLVKPETFWFKSFDGTPVQGWLMRPLSFSPGRKYPIVLTIHGGPHGMYGYSFNLARQTMAAHGYGILSINPRGSAGYGQAFSDGCVNDWGGADYKDVLAGLDHVLARTSWIDRRRMGVMGLSYGGYMTNWIITHNRRFKAAVVVSGISNLVSFYGTSIYQDLIHVEFGGKPWQGDNYEKLWRHSPLAYVKNTTTPTLFLYGEDDNDVHITEAEQMYMALRRQEVETMLVRYPREGHGIREPLHRFDETNRTLAWFDRHLRPDSHPDVTQAKKEPGSLDPR